MNTIKESVAQFKNRVRMFYSERMTSEHVNFDTSETDFCFALAEDDDGNHVVFKHDVENAITNENVFEKSTDALACYFEHVARDCFAISFEKSTDDALREIAEKIAA